jgi:predicted dehydrogenase
MKVIQVGIGNMGGAWLNAVLKSEEVEYAGFVEINDAIAEEQAGKYDLDRSLIFKTLEEALTRVQADAVIDVTPPRFHMPIAVTAMEAGLHVLTEKPLSDTLEAAQMIVRKQQETGLVHMVAQNRRYYPAVQTARRILQSGEMGRIAAVTAEHYRNLRLVNNFRTDMSYPLIIDMAIHHFDLMRCFLGCNPLTVYGRTWNPAWSTFKNDASASVLFEFENKALVSYNASWCSQGAETAWNGTWRFDCEKGVLIMRDNLVYKGEASDWNKDYNAPLEPLMLDSMPYAHQTYLLHEFYEAVTTGKPPVTTGADNLYSLGMVFDTIRSFESGVTVRCGTPDV